MAEITLPKVSWERIKEFPALFWLNLKVQAHSLADFARVASRYYSNTKFRQIDTALLLVYLFDNPFSVSKRFLREKGKEELYAYGETPLPSLEQIAKTCQLGAEDTLFELGCGRGRGCFWLRSFIGCNVIGIDYVPPFIERANRVKERYQVEGIEFRCEDMFEVDLSGATVLYLYGTCLDEEAIKKLIERFKELPAGTKIITVSYPLTDYTEEPLFEVMKRFEVPYTWGIADVYLHLKK